MIELIPAIDIIDGKCVRLTKGDYDTKKIYNEDPVSVAKEFEAHGIRRLHVVDLDGARSKHIVNDKVLQRIARETNLVIDFGGGIKTDEDVARAFEAGAHMITIGSIAVTDPERSMEWLHKYGPEHIVLGADVRNGRVSINGWKEDSQEELVPFLDRYLSEGMRNVLCTDISKDGMLQGPAIALYREVMEHYPDCHLIASGGVSSMDDIRALEAAGIPAVVFGKAIYEGKLKLEELC